MTNLTDLTLNECLTGLEQKKFSSVELVSACLKRSESLQPSLNAFTEITSGLALEQAKRADATRAQGERKPLLGLPIAIKDVIVTKGVRTTCASKILANFIPPYSATVIEKLEDAGAVIIGKTNMDEFAMGSSNEHSAFGAVKNPWDLNRVPGGSSGGSAAVVAARCAPVSLGTDTGGSIRQPASLTGIVGLKPTYGRVSRYGLIAFASSLDQIGPFTRSVEDSAIILETLAGHDPRDSTSAPLEVPRYRDAATTRSLKGLRIGIPKEYFIGGLQPEVQKSVGVALETLRSLGATTVDISLPHTDAGVAVYYIVASAEASSNLARFDGVRYGHRSSHAEDLHELYANSRSDGFGAEVKRRILIGTYVLSSGYYDAYYIQAQKVRALVADDFTKAFSSHCDVIACPVAPTTAFPIGEKSNDPLSMYLNDVFTIPTNLAGLPGMSLPCGFDGKGLPIGLHVIGKHFDESSLFRVGAAYQATTTWHTSSPKLIG